MNRPPSDQAARGRFAAEWGTNFAVVANAGSGKTTAISRRLAEMALTSGGGEALRRTAVVTYTKKAARQIGQRARAELLRRMDGAGSRDGAALASLDRAFFGTIHSFCILLARRHGSTLGVHMNPVLVDPDHEDAAWQRFLEQDAMEFSVLSPEAFRAFLRHASVDRVFELAKELGVRSARRLVAAGAPSEVAGPSPSVLQEILDAKAARASPKLARNKEVAQAWYRRFREEDGPLPIAKPDGVAGGIDELYRRFFAPLKGWLAAAGGALAGELSLRYQAWREEQGIQTYADQVETALAVLGDARMLDQIRAENWRVILDEAQDADPSQLAVLVEIARPPGAPIGQWPASGAGPRAGHFCMVGDAQQGIYSERADIRSFNEHVGAFRRGDSGECLVFDVTFRSPASVVELLNRSLPAAFGPARACNLDVRIPGLNLQVPYEPLVAAPGAIRGGAWRLSIPAHGLAKGKGYDDRRLAHEARALARSLRAGGPEAVGGRAWGDLCVLAPRRAWLALIREAFEEEGIPTALQMRRERAGDHPAYAWLCGLLAVACDPANAFEWVGVLREVFGVSDAEIARVLRDGSLRWDEPDAYPEETHAALSVLGPFIGRVDSEGEPLQAFAEDLVAACGLRERARAADPAGAVGEELSRLLARAAALGAEGGGPRQWLGELLEGREALSASGRPSADAVNLITSHSAKGLEWEVVLPLGLWRKVSHYEGRGLRLVSELGAAPRVVFDNEGVGEEAAEARRRALAREVVRLLYVTLTRARAALVIPWADGQEVEEGSFADLWGFDPAGLATVEAAPVGQPPQPPEPASPEAAPEAWAAPARSAAPAALPARVLPHQLGSHADLGRSGRHEASLDDLPPARDDADPLEYGVWWHEMLEFIPWAEGDAAVDASAEASLARARERGFEARGREEWARLRRSEPWAVMREARWGRLAEVGVFAALPPGRWIDGVIDLVLHDASSGEVWIVDWKTNRRRGGEDDRALLARLVEEYRGQLEAYGACASGFFPGAAPRLWVYSTGAGAWAEITPEF